jgi:predicted transcriptional regulator
MAQLKVRRYDFETASGARIGSTPVALALQPRSSPTAAARFVGDVMHRDLVTMRPAATVLSAQAMLRRQRINHLLVPMPHGTPAVLCACDLLAEEPRMELAWIVSSRVITIDPSSTLLDAANLMRRTEVGALPVMAWNRLVGIVTRGDLHRCGFAKEATGPVCSSCGSHHHVRRLVMGGVRRDDYSCLDCYDRTAPHQDDGCLDLGGEG